MKLWSSKMKMVYLTLIGLALALVHCGKEDARNGNCTLYGNDCNDPEEGHEDKTDPNQGQTVGPRGPQGPKGDSCTIEQVPEGAVWTCGENSVLITHGVNGINGDPGNDGFSLAIETLNIAPSCLNGGHTILLSLDTNRNGQVDPLSDANLQSMELCNGLNGDDGEDGEDAPPSEFTPVAIVDPCGDALGFYDEVFLRLYNGQLLWSLSDNTNGKNTRFSLAVPGDWMTTDGSECYFTIDANNNVINEYY